MTLAFSWFFRSYNSLRYQFKALDMQRSFSPAKIDTWNVSVSKIRWYSWPTFSLLAFQAWSGIVNEEVVEWKKRERFGVELRNRPIPPLLFSLLLYYCAISAPFAISLWNTKWNRHSVSYQIWLIALLKICSIIRSLIIQQIQAQSKAITKAEIQMRAKLHQHISRYVCKTMNNTTTESSE